MLGTPFIFSNHIWLVKNIHNVSSFRKVLILSHPNEPPLMFSHHAPGYIFLREWLYTRWHSFLTLLSPSMPVLHDIQSQVYTSALILTMFSHAEQCWFGWAHFKGEMILWGKKEDQALERVQEDSGLSASGEGSRADAMGFWLERSRKDSRHYCRMRRQRHCVKSNRQQDAVRIGQVQMLRLAAEQTTTWTISQSRHAGLTWRVGWDRGCASCEGTK